MADTVDDTGELATLIRRRRLELGLTQSGAARNAGLSITTWQSLEKADGAPSVAFQELSLSKAARSLGLPLEEVFRAAGRPAPGGHALSLLEEQDAASWTLGDTRPRNRKHDDPDVLLSELERRLRTLREQSEPSFLLLARQSLTLAEHLLQLHADEAADAPPGQVGVAPSATAEHHRADG